MKKLSSKRAEREASPSRRELARLAREFFCEVGDSRTSVPRLRLAAWVRLALVVPFVLIPAAFGLNVALATSHDLGTAAPLFRVWLAVGLAFVAVNLALVVVARAGGDEARPGLARALTYLALSAELLANQLAMHLVGPITSHGPIYIVVIVAVYRVFFDYRIARFATIVGVILYGVSAWLGFAAIVPAGAILPAFEHPVHDDPLLAALVIHTVIVAIVFTFFAVNFAVNQTARLHRYMTESVLGRYLPPSLVARAARGELRLDAEPERRVVTVMFTDLVGFTSLAERIGERDVARMLNQYLSRCADVAHAHGATIDKFIGDAVMVLLGAPDELAPEEQAYRCVRLAFEMQATLDDTPLQMRAGINTGEVIVGHFGSITRSDFTAVGHAVNLAARLETSCAPGRILLGEQTARLVGAKLALEPAGEFRLKGISAPVKAYYVAEPGEPGAPAEPKVAKARVGEEPP